MKKQKLVKVEMHVTPEQWEDVCRVEIYKRVVNELKIKQPELYHEILDSLGFEDVQKTTH